MRIKHTKVEDIQGNVTLYVYLNDFSSEFANELGSKGDVSVPLKEEIGMVVQSKYPGLKINAVKIILGTMMVAGFPFHEVQVHAASTTPTAAQTTSYTKYQVQSGDTLYKLAAKFDTTITELRKQNNLKTDNLYVGQMLTVPIYTYTVTKGDTLSIIAKRYNSTVERIKAINNLKSDMIYLGQKLLIPAGVTTPSTTTTVPPPSKPVQTVPAVPEKPPVTVTTDTYRVVAGDTLSLIAKKFGTTVDNIKKTNGLTTDLIMIGQTLKIPANQTAPTAPVITQPPIQSTYTVVAGDTLSIIANKYKTTVLAIKDANKLTSDMIYIGQQLTIPNATTETILPPIDETKPSTTQETNYLVVAGDTLSIIATKFHTSSAAIKDRNHLTSDLILIGQTLTIPANTAPDAPVPPVDTTPPVIQGVTAADNINAQNVSSYSITGIGEAGSSVSFVITDKNNIQVQKTGSVSSNGTFAENFNLASLTDGQVTIQIESTDKAGNKSETFTRTSIKDTVAPANLAIKEINNITANNQKAYTINGTTDPQSTVNIKISDGIHTNVATATADDTGVFSVEVDTSGLSDGNILLNAQSVDAFGNEGVPVDKKIIKDTVAPKGLTLLGTDRTITKNTQGEYHVHGTSDEDGAIVEITASDGKTVVEKTALVVNKSYDIPIDLAKLSDGEIKFTVKQKDTLGNESDPLTFTQIKDTVSNVPVVNKSTVSNNSGVFTYQMQGKAEPNSDILLSVVGTAGTNALKQQVHTANDGSYTLTMNISSYIDNHPFITVKQVDAARNESSQIMSPINSYVVGSGDTLWKIATRFNSSTSDIMTLNQLTSSMIGIGQELKLPMVAGLETNAISETNAFNMGYLYFGSSPDFIKTMKQTNGTINVVSPTYFNLNSDGTLKLTNLTDRYFIASMQSSNVRVVPFISNHWDREVGNAALKNREQLSQQIADNVALFNLDGVNVDIENVTEEYRDEYVDFVRLLREKLPKGKEVSVAVAANPTGSNTGWHGSYDYNQLAKYSDYLMVMAYDESYPGSAPGPIASSGFVADSIQYALDQGVPKDKVVLGIGHYGRYWKVGDPSGGAGISNQQISELVKQYNGTVTFDEATKSPKATFTIKASDPKPSVYGTQLTAGDYVVWFENDQSIKEKYDLVEKYGIKGTGNWGIEQENPDFWNTFASWVTPTEDVTGTVNKP